MGIMDTLIELLKMFVVFSIFWVVVIICVHLAERFADIMFGT